MQKLKKKRGKRKKKSQIVHQFMTIWGFEEEKKKDTYRNPNVLLAWTVMFGLFVHHAEIWKTFWKEKPRIF